MIHSDERNQVSVLSGRDRDSLNTWLSGVRRLLYFVSIYPPIIPDFAIVTDTQPQSIRRAWLLPKAKELIQ